MSWENRYSRIPFIDKGRDEKGCDCFGLVRLVLARECGIALPSYDLVSAADFGVIELESRLPGWLTVCGQMTALDMIALAQPFDVVLIKSRRDGRAHIGIVSSQRKILHTAGGFGVTLVPFTHHSMGRLLSLHRRQELVGSLKP